MCVPHQAAVLAAAGRHEPHHDGRQQGTDIAGYLQYLQYLQYPSTRTPPPPPASQSPWRPAATSRTTSRWGWTVDSRHDDVGTLSDLTAQVILAGFAEQSKTSVVHMCSLFHSFILSQLWTVYLEYVTPTGNTKVVIAAVYTISIQYLDNLQYGYSI